MNRKVLVATIVLLGLFQTAEAETLQSKVQQFCSDVGASSSASVGKFSMDDAVRILKEEGFAIKKIKPHEARIKVAGRSLLLLQAKDGDFQMYYGTTGVKVDFKDINQWNRKRRLSRAYLDSDRDPALEFDLDAGAGLTPKQLVKFVKTFSNTSVPLFVDYLLDHDKSK